MTKNVPKLQQTYNYRPRKLRKHQEGSIRKNLHLYIAYSNHKIRGKKEMLKEGKEKNKVRNANFSSETIQLRRMC